jgi:hypothetical protein
VPVLAIVIHYFWKRRLIQQRIAAGELPPNFLAIPIRNRTLAWETWNLGGLPVKNHDPGPRPELHEICTGEESSLGEEAEYWSGLTVSRPCSSCLLLRHGYMLTMIPALHGKTASFCKSWIDYAFCDPLAATWRKQKQFPGTRKVETSSLSSDLSVVKRRRHPGIYNRFQF